LKEVAKKLDLFQRGRLVAYSNIHFIKGNGFKPLALSKGYGDGGINRDEVWIF
jgi:hypothetical protein